jgi:catechol 2,3-dioxygenase-like lactoylglutathione lyase family enzyme
MFMRPAFAPLATHLSYVALRTADLARARDYYGGVLGLAESAGDGSEAAYYSVGGTHHDVILRPGKASRQIELGFRLCNGMAPADFARIVRDAGLPADLQSDAMPGVATLVEVAAPGGNIMQFHAEEDDSGPVFSNAGIAPLRLGHVAVISPEAPKLRTFYEEVLGFHYTDDFEGIATFLTCNRDHHVVNLVNAPESRVHHIAFELVDNAQHARACDMLARARIPTLWGPARHTAGHNLAGYHYDPNQIMIELYTQMDVYIPELGLFEPRPWHDAHPMRPKTRKVTEMTIWETEYQFDLVKA